MRFLGIDGGGTACRAAVIDEEGDVVFLAQGGAANFSSTPTKTLHRSIEQALKLAPTVQQICGCFAGLVHEEARQQAARIVGLTIPGIPVSLMPDYAAALRASPEETTVCVIAGTGSIVCSKSSTGFVKSGGGGPLLGDEGSGFAYGRHLIREFLRTGEGPEKLLVEIRKKLGTIESNEVLGRIYTSAAPAALVASFAASFFRDVTAGAEYAKSALEQETKLLAKTVMLHLERYHSTEIEPMISLAGSIWKRKAARDAFENALPKSARWALVEKPPVIGAALLARDIFMGEV